MRPISIDGPGELGNLIQGIVDAAIESEMAWAGFMPDGLGGFSKDSGTGEPHLLHGPGQGASPGEIASEGLWADQVYQRYASEVPAAFAPYTDIPDPDDLDAVASAYARVVQRLAPSGETGADASDDVSADPQWAAQLLELATPARQGVLSGGAIDAYMRNYALLMPTVVQNQFLVVHRLFGAIVGEQVLWTGFRQGLLDVAKDTEKAMVAARPGGGGGASTAWKLLGVGLLVLGSFLDPGVLLATVAVGSAAADAVSEHVKEHEVRIEGGHPSDVLASLHGVLAHLNDDLTREESTIASNLQGKLREVQGQPGYYAVGAGQHSPAAPEPFVEHDGYGSKEIRLVWDQISDLVLTDIPAVASRLRNLALLLDPWSASDGWRRGDGLGIGPTGPFPDFASLGDAMEGCLLETSRCSIETGEHLRILAKDMRQHDHGVFENLRAHTREVERVERFLGNTVTTPGQQTPTPS